jgi:hypothetical protein
MTRSVLVLTLVALPAAAAPAVKSRTVFYHPTGVGNTRVYETTSDNVGPQEHTEEVTKVEVKDNAFQVTVRRSNVGPGGADSTFEVSTKGVTRMKLGTRETVSPLLRLPAKAGDTWTFERQPLPGAAFLNAKQIYTMGGEEDLDVPAGKFRAVRVEMESFVEDEKRASATAWYAPGVGLVKSVTKLGANERTQVLKSYKPGK